MKKKAVPAILLSAGLLVMMVVGLSWNHAVYAGAEAAIGVDAAGTDDADVDLEPAVSAAVKKQGAQYLAGECLTEGHRILAVRRDREQWKVYILASAGWFGFENQIFTRISGSGAIPSVLTFKQNEEGRLMLLSYTEPMDGMGYTASIKQLFPTDLWDAALYTARDYPALTQQQEAQAAEYLQGIGRTAAVSAAYVPKESLALHARAANTILAWKTKDPVLSFCPDWIGTKERIEAGSRYIYTSAKAPADNGGEVLIFSKRTEDGRLVAEKRYRVDGDEVWLAE